MDLRDAPARGVRVNTPRRWPKAYGLTPLAEELMVYHTLPQLPWGALDAMDPAQVETLCEFVRLLEHRRDERDEALITAMRLQR